MGLTHTQLESLTKDTTDHTNKRRTKMPVRNPIIEEHLNEVVSQGLKSKQGYEIYLKEDIASQAQRPPMGFKRYRNIFYETKAKRTLKFKDGSSAKHGSPMRAIPEVILKMPKALFIDTIKRGLKGRSGLNSDARMKESEWAKDYLSILALTVMDVKSKSSEGCGSDYLCSCISCNKELLKKLFELKN